MMQRRWKLSLAQRADMWGRWKAGQSLNTIGRALGKDKQVIHFLLARHGGITPRVRRRSRRALTLAEPEDIFRGVASGSSMRVIAQHLHRVHRACSTVSREVARHGGRARYRADETDQHAWVMLLRPKPCLLSVHSKLREVVALRRQWLRHPDSHSCSSARRASGIAPASTHTIPLTGFWSFLPHSESSSGLHLQLVRRNCDDRFYERSLLFIRQNGQNHRIYGCGIIPQLDVEKCAVGARHA